MNNHSRYLLGISAWYHDSAAVLLCDGVIVAAAQEERFSRIKNDPAFPAQAVTWCLAHAGISLQDVAYVTYYDKPFIKFERLLETALHVAPYGVKSFCKSMPIWVKEKLFIKANLRQQLAKTVGCKTREVPPLLFTTHHQAHAASAFYASNFSKAVVLCLDGVGEWVTTSAWRGEGAQLQPLWQQDFPHSLGLLYSAFTWYCGFKVNSGEYKLMGLAPYGEPRYLQLILDELIDIKADGSYRLNMQYFGWCEGEGMITPAFEKLFGGPRREPESWLTQRDMDLAASIQKALEFVVVRICKALQVQTGERQLCLAGGVALNCVANTQILRECGFDEVWVQPAAGDAGGALGAALATWYDYLQNVRPAVEEDSMQGALLGPAFTNEEVEQVLQQVGARYQRLPADTLYQQTAQLLADGNVVGWFQGRAEFGPRALGARSILADPRSMDMQSRLNVKIKFRESFRPFAPAVLAECQHHYFDFPQPSPYMLFTAPVQESKRLAITAESATGIERLKQQRSTLPAITHVDYSARLQTVSAATNAAFYQLLLAFRQLTGCAVLINTSFNVRGEPIVGSPMDAWRCFMKTDMDYLLVGNFLLSKQEQGAYQEQAPIAPRKSLMWFGRWLLQRWIDLGVLLGKLTTPIILSVIYFLLVCPLAWWRKRKTESTAFAAADSQLATYKVATPQLHPKDMEHPY